MCSNPAQVNIIFAHFLENLLGLAGWQIPKSWCVILILAIFVAFIHQTNLRFISIRIFQMCEKDIDPRRIRTHGTRFGITCGYKLLSYSTGRLSMSKALQYSMGIGPGVLKPSVIKLTLIVTLKMPHDGINYRLTSRNRLKTVNICCDLIIWPWPKSSYSLNLSKTSGDDSSPSDLANSWSAEWKSSRI